MVRKQWSKSDIKSFLESFPLAQSIVSKKSIVVQEDTVLFIDHKPLFFFVENKWVPTLHLLISYNDFLPKVVVDKGAIKFVVNGADIMRPGVTACDNVKQDNFVVIVDENYNKPLAIGQVLCSSQELLASTQGKVVKNLHRIGDEIWSSTI